MWPLLLSCFILLLGLFGDLPISHSLRDQQSPLVLHNESQSNAKCGVTKIPFPFHLNGSIPNAFHLSCENSTTLFLKFGTESYRVLEFFSDGILVDFPGSSSSCRQYNDLNSFDFAESDSYGVSVDNVIGLYDCDDSSLCKAECETIRLPGCDGKDSSSPACCYPLSDHSVWKLGDKFSVFSKFGCRGFSSWVVLPASNSGKRGVKLEWAIRRNSSKAVCSGNAVVANATAVEDGVRCSCPDGFVGNGFADGTGCLKSCIKNRRETYGHDCYTERHSDKKLVIVAGALASVFIIASLMALFWLLKRPAKAGLYDPHRDHFHSSISFRKACRTRLFTYHELEAATKGFEEGQQLADGDNGTIYAGVLGDGSHIAVHKIKCETERDLIQVVSQIEVLSAVLHRNMSNLLGCCIDLAYTPLVVYEYPANGTLEEHLHQRREHKTGLDWSRRLNIVAETASVLAFLHYDMCPPIFHNDLRSGYIFLDENFSAKIAGFSLLSSRKEHSENNLEGFRFQKNDVYDFGRLLLEIIGGSSSLELPTVALQKIRNGKVEEIVDPGVYYHEQPSVGREQIERVADVATRCLLFGGEGKIGMVDVSRELGHITKGGIDGGSRRGPVLEETFSNSSLLQMISMSPDSIHVP